MNNTGNTLRTLSYIAMGRETGQASQLTIRVLVSLTILYFISRDLELYISIQRAGCTSNSSQPALSVKYLLQPPTIHYVELPLSEIMERTFTLSHFLSPNTVSLAGVLLGQLAAVLICRGRRTTVLLGVLLYKVRDLGDSLDGVLARGVGRTMVPTPGTPGYYLDGWCDILSETALIYSVGHLIHRERTRAQVLISKASQTNPSVIARLLAPLTSQVWGLGLQSILSAVAWNWTTEQLHFTLETQAEHSVNVNTNYLASPTACMVVFLWRLLNPHMLTQALLVSLLLDRPAQWVEITKYVVTFPLLCLSLMSYLLVYTLKAKHK